ncbi:arrestin domain-containing protein 3-like [Diretmus argenteus]
MFQDTFKNFNIGLNALNERNTCSSGDLMTGQVTFELTKQTKISSLVLTLRGIAQVHWSTSSGGGRRRRRHRRHYSAKLEYFKCKSQIMEGDSTTDGAVKLQPGTHVYPFTWQLPHGNFPSTFHGVHGKVVYTLTVGINRPWHMTKEYVTQLNFVHHIDANQPELLAPLTGSNSMTVCCLWCASGPITMTVRLERKAFVPGETVKIMCEFSNASSRRATPKASLSQKQMFYTAERVHKRMYVKKLVSETGQPVSPHSSDVYSEILLTIPSTPLFTISNCAILEVDYIIEVGISNYTRL